MKIIDIIKEYGVHMDDLLDYAADDCHLTPAERATLHVNGYVELRDVDAVVVLEDEPEEFNRVDSIELTDDGFKRKTIRF